MKKIRSLIIALILFVISTIAVFTIAGCSSGSTPGTNNDPAQNLTFTLLEDDTYSVKTTNKKIEGALIIPSTHEGKAVTVVDKSGFSNCQLLTSVSIPSSINTVDEKAFENCTGLKTISFVDDKNHSVKVSEKAFYNCWGITEITLPSLVALKRYAFADCGDITVKYPGTLSQYIQKVGEEQQWSSGSNKTMVYLGDSE